MGTKLHDLIRPKGLTFDERTRNGLNPQPIGLKETARSLFELLAIAVAVIARPTGVIFDDLASAPVVVFIARIVNTLTVQVVRYRPGHHGQNAGFDIEAFFRRVLLDASAPGWHIIGELSFAGSAIHRDDGDPKGRSVANCADNGVAGLMKGGSFIFD